MTSVAQRLVCDASLMWFLSIWSMLVCVCAVVLLFGLKMKLKNERYDICGNGSCGMLLNSSLPEVSVFQRQTLSSHLAREG